MRGIGAHLRLFGVGQRHQVVDQVDQQARMNMKLVPQYGGTVGGVRRKAVEAIGASRSDVLGQFLIDERFQLGT